MREVRKDERNEKEEKVCNSRVETEGYSLFKNRETEEPYVLEVNANPGLTGIESTNKGITTEVFTYFKNRDNWRK